MKILETSRLVLKPTHPDWFEDLWSAVERSRTELRVWMHWAIEPDADEQLDFMRKAEREWKEGHERHFTLFYEGSTCGHCSLDHADPVDSSFEMGYWLRSDLCGRRLMTEAVRAVVDYAFEVIEAHRIELHAGVDNQASIRVAEKVGFRREGVLREAGRGAGGFYHSYVYGLLKTDERP